MKDDRILFAKDFSPISDRAESYACQFAAGCNARVVILHAIEPIAGMEEGADDHLTKFLDNLRSKAETRAVEVVNRFRDRDVDCDVVIQVKPRWKAVVDVAAQENADLIVVGSHAIQEDGKMYIGTTSHKVFFSTDRPIMVVPQG